jgi:hypothetical protein
MRVFEIGLLVSICTFAWGCRVSATPASQSAVAAPKSLIQSGDQLYVLIEDMEGPGSIFRAERTVDKNGVVDLQWIGNVHLGGVPTKDAPAVIHRACRTANLDGEGRVWVWRLEGMLPANDPDAPLSAGDLLKIVMPSVDSPQTEEFLARIDADGIPWCSPAEAASWVGTSATTGTNGLRQSTGAYSEMVELSVVTMATSEAGQTKCLRSEERAE